MLSIKSTALLLLLLATTGTTLGAGPAQTPKPKAKVSTVEICTQTFSGVFDDSMIGGGTGWATTVPVTDCVSNTTIGTLTQTCNGNYFWSVEGVPLTRACTNTITIGGSSLTYAEFVNATAVGITQGSPTPMDVWTSNVISMTGTGIFKQGRVNKMIRSVVDAVTGPIIDGTTTAWDGTVCSAGGFPCYRTKITLSYTRKGYGTHMW